MTTDAQDGPAQVLAEILAEVLDIEAETVRPDQSLVGLGLDSLPLIEVVISVEQAFGLVIAPADARRLATVGDLTSYVEQRLAAT